MAPSSKPKNKGLIVTVLLAGAFVAVLNQTLLNTAIPNIMATLDIGPTKAQWLTTGFMLVNGIMIPITAFLIEKFATRQLFFVEWCYLRRTCLILASLFSLVKRIL